jgi:hypothetical protein
MKYSEGIEFDGEWIKGERGKKGIFKFSPNQKTKYLSFDDDDYDPEVIEEFENL